MRLLAVSLAALALLGALAGCGGGGEDPASTAVSTSTVQESATGEQRRQAQPNDRGPSSGPTEPVRRHVPIGELAPGSKAVAPGVPVTRGGDNSIQTFGAEGERDEATQALAAFDEFMRARLAGDWPAACGAASEEFRKQLGMLGEHAKPRKEGVEIPEGCAGALKLLAGGIPAARLRPTAQVTRELSFRVRDDDYAYLIYEDSEGAIRFIAMARDKEVWRVNTLEPTAFPEPGDQGSAQ